MSTSNNNKLEYSSLSNHQCQPLESKNNTATSLEFSNAGYQWIFSRFGIHEEVLKQFFDRLSILNFKHDCISDSLQTLFSQFKELLKEHEEQQFSKSTARKIFEKCGFPSSNKVDILIARSRLISVLRPFALCAHHSEMGGSKMELSRTLYRSLLDLSALFPSKLKTDGNIKTNKLVKIDESLEEEMENEISQLKPDRFVQYQWNAVSNQRKSDPMKMIRVVEEDSYEGNNEDFMKLVKELRVLHCKNIRALLIDEKQSFHETFATYGLLVSKSCVEVMAITAVLNQDTNYDRIYYNLHYIGSFDWAKKDSKASSLELCAMLLAILHICVDEQQQIEDFVRQRKNTQFGSLDTRKGLHIQLLPDDEIVLTSNSCYEIKGTVQTCEDTTESLEGKQVVFVKSRSTSFYLTIFNSALNVSHCKPPLSIFLKDVNSCKVFRDSSLLATPKNFEVSLCGQCLTKLLSSLTPESKKRTVIELLCETQFIHSRNIIHNDIKLDNIVIYTDKKQLQYSKYIDFELSKRFDKYNMNEEVCTDNNAETLFSGSGTPGHYPPEKLAVMNDRNTVDLRYSLTPKSDIYSLGIVLLEILTGNSVNDSYSIEDAFATLSRDYDFANMHGIISCMIHPDKSKRPTASMILQTLIQEKGWDLKLAHEGWKKARTSLTEDFWKTHGVLERDLFDDAINNVTLEQLVQVTTTSESSEENKKRNNHPTVDVTANKKWKHASNK